ncbi:uncharacterized protein G2W53_014734 [Senna tora]|uniref:Uncharacterized protein n=1 Tax=Senna tora TaxID=362788 RepID=A0A834WU09_9FABA|nr:uncharacterized protein G2W53_014734 [Senna tora]
MSETRQFALHLGNRVELMLELESSWQGRSVEHVLTYSVREIGVGSQKHYRITRQKPCCTIERNILVRVVFVKPSGVEARIGVAMAREERERNRSVRVVFGKPSGLNARIGVVMAWEGGRSCLNIFQMRNHGRISETFTNDKAKALLRRNVNELRGKSFVAQIMPKHILNEKSRSNLRNVQQLRGKGLVSQLRETRQFALYLRNGAHLMLEFESSWHGRSVDHVFAYSVREIAVGS